MNILSGFFCRIFYSPLALSDVSAPLAVVAASRGIDWMRGGAQSDLHKVALRAGIAYFFARVAVAHVYRGIEMFRVGTVVFKTWSFLRDAVPGDDEIPPGPEYAHSLLLTVEQHLVGTSMSSGKRLRYTVRVVDNDRELFRVTSPDTTSVRYLVWTDALANLLNELVE